MIITKTPFRISFFGGGTDYPVYYDNNGGGVVLSTSINKYCYITCRYLPPFLNTNIGLSGPKAESVKSVDEIQHPAVRAGLKFLIFRMAWKFITTAICRLGPVLVQALLLRSAWFTLCTPLKGR